MDHIKALRIETMRIAESPRLRRSPKLRALLLFLLQHASDPARLTQYDVATEGLGRPLDFDETTDTSVRSSMTRLRSALAEHYAIEQPHNGVCVYIRPGEYRLRAGSLAIAYPELSKRMAEAVANHTGGTNDGLEQSLLRDEAQALPATDDFRVAASERQSLQKPSPAALSTWRGLALIAALAVVLSIALYLQPQKNAVLRATAVQPVSVPVVAFETNIAGSGDADAFARMLDAEADKALQRSMISCLVQSPDQAADYTIKMSAVLPDAGDFNASLILSNGAGRILREDTLVLSGNKKADLITFRTQVYEWLFPTGAIARDVLKRVGERPASGFECFLVVENMRAAGSSARELAAECVLRFPRSDFLPYLQTRQLFYHIQDRIVTEGAIFPTSREWLSISELMEAHEDNPYLTTLGAKALFSQNRCREAYELAAKGLPQSRTYVALELTILVEALGCRDLEPAISASLAERVDRISANEEQPTPLAETYLVLASLALGERDKALNITKRPFRKTANTEMTPFSEELDTLLRRRGSVSEYNHFEQQLRRLVFNPATRANIVGTLRSSSREAAVRATS